MKAYSPFVITFLTIVILSACSSTPKNNVLKSYLSTPTLSEDELNLDTEQGSISSNATNNIELKGKMKYYGAKKSDEEIINKDIDLKSLFSATDYLKITADELELKDYLHYVLGDVLKVSYVLGEEINTQKKAVSLNLQTDISKSRLFMLTENLLVERGFVIRLDNDIFYIHKAESSSSSNGVAYGYGYAIENVPNSSLDIIQIVPFNYGVQSNLQRLVSEIAKVKTIASSSNNAFILRGKRKEIIKALELIKIMDQPSLRGRVFGVYKTIYVATDEIKNKLPELLSNEGISVGVDRDVTKAISIVSIERTGTIIFFANDKTIIERAEFWITQIDQPPSGSELQYFMYHPNYSRAADVGESLNLLISGNANNISSSTSAAMQNSNSKPIRKPVSSFSVENEKMKLVIDERANTLIFYTTGDEYRNILPLIKRLDVMPKQVILEMMIAEVKLTDTFKQGVDFFLTNKGTTIAPGGFSAASGSGGLTYLLSGLNGSLTVNLLQTNSNVNVLSRPSLLVRDGVTAKITVGDDIPTVGEIITDPVNGSKTSVVYRKTGVELEVTPTINARGVVIMEINQRISNQATGDATVAGSPIIFERSISTEAVAESGQTIVLGGLISENRTLSDRSVPFFSSIPLIGGLFDGQEDSQDKTELVVLMTPKIIESSEEWQDIKSKLESQFKQLRLQKEK